MKTLIKKCIVCGKEFTKPYTCGIPEWKRRKFCSKSCINKGRIPWNYYLKPIRCFTCNKVFKPRLNNSKYCSRKCCPTEFKIGHKTWILGKHHSKETKRKISENHKRKDIKPPCGKEKSYAWKGGVSKENLKLRRTARYRNWRKAVYERDDYTCRKCNKKGGKLHPHHIKDWGRYPELRFKVSNGKTLCIPCHRQTDSYLKNLYGSTS